MPAHRPTTLTAPALAAALLLAGTGAGGARAQGQPVDRGTADLGPNSASQRVVHPGLGQFSPEGALTDRFAVDPVSQLADFYAPQRDSRRYLYQSPGVAALYNQSSYLTRDGQGVVGINGTNAGLGDMLALTPADTVYILSPDLLDAPPLNYVEAPPPPGQVDHRLRATPATYPVGNAGPDGRVATQVDGRFDPDRPRVIDIAAMNQQVRGARRDPRLVERSRRWKEEREREAAAQAQREAEQADDAQASQPEDAEPVPAPADEPGAEQ